MVPVWLTTMRGRDEHRDELASLTTAHRLVTVLGEGGSGKTRTVAAVAGRLDSAVRWVDLATIGNGEPVAGEVATQLGVTVGPASAELSLCAEFETSEATLVLDNAEHVRQAAATLTLSLLSRCPTLRIVCTSRVALDVAGEVTWRLPQLAVSDAILLFNDRVCDVQGGLRLMEAETTRSICEHLAGNPLAIELAAARCRSLSLAQVAAGLETGLDLLTTRSTHVPDRHRSVARSLDWSYELLDPTSAMVLRRLSQLVGLFDLDTAIALVTDSDLERTDVVDAIDVLVAHSFVVVAADRYRILEVIRQYAAARSTEVGELEDLRARHATVFGSRAIQGGPAAELDHAHLWPLVEQMANLRPALQTLDRHGRVAELGEAVVALRAVWMMPGNGVEGLGWIDRTLARSTAIDESTIARRARLLALRAYLAVLTGSASAVVDTERAVEAADASGDLWALSRSAYLRCHILNSVGQSAAFRALLPVARERAHAAGDLAVIRTLRFIESTRFIGRHPRLLPPLPGSEAVPSFCCLEALSELFVSVLGGEWTLASDALATFRQTYDPRVERAVFVGIVELCRAIQAAFTGDGLVTGLGELQRTAIARGDGMSWAYLRCAEAWTLAPTAASPNDLAAIDAALDDAAKIPMNAELHSFMRGAVTLARNDSAAARLSADQLAVADEPESMFKAEAHRIHAVADLIDGHHDRALERAHDALAQAVSADIGYQIVMCVETVALCEAMVGRTDEARRLVDACSAERDRIGYRWAGLAEPTLWDQVELPGPSEQASVDPSFNEVVAALRRRRGPRRRPTSGWDALTPTERLVVDHVVNGASNPEIARTLSISSETVKTHLSSIFAKLGVANRTALASLAARR